jgi:hypothetical protein
LHDATIAALALPEVHDQLREQDAEVVGGSPADDRRLQEHERHNHS